MFGCVVTMPGRYSETCAEVFQNKLQVLSCKGIPELTDQS
jgi:hypothetical protein